MDLGLGSMLALFDPRDRILVQNHLPIWYSVQFGPGLLRLGVRSSFGKPEPVRSGPPFKQTMKKNWTWAVYGPFFTKSKSWIRFGFLPTVHPPLPFHIPIQNWSYAHKWNQKLDFDVMFWIQSKSQSTIIHNQKRVFWGIHRGLSCQKLCIKKSSTVCILFGLEYSASHGYSLHHHCGRRVRSSK